MADEVAFLFADVEGSTRLVQRLGDDWVGALAQLRGVLRDEIAAAGGREADARGDEVFALFDGLRAAAEIRARFPEVGVLVLSSHLELEYASELLSGGAAGIGYLLKDRVADVDDFAAAVRRVGASGAALDRNVVAELMDRLRRPVALDLLTRAQRDLFELAAEGRSNEAIAQRLFVTLATVEADLAVLFAKLGLPEDEPAEARVLTLLDYLQR